MRGTCAPVSPKLGAPSSDRLNSPLHKTTDTYLASFLKCQGAALEGFTRVGPKRVEFRFVADERLHDLLRLYWSGIPVLLVPSLLFADLRALKSRSLPRS